MGKLLNKASCFGSSVGDSGVDPLSDDAESAAGHGARWGGEAQRGPAAARRRLRRAAASMQLCRTALKPTLHFRVPLIYACAVQLIVHQAYSCETRTVVLRAANEYRV